MDERIQFIPFTESDLTVFKKWLKAPHVAEFWQESDDDLLLREKFLNLATERHVFPHIFTFEERPIGYIQYYEACKVGGGWWPEIPSAVFGIDQFIGDFDFVGKGIGTKVITQFCKIIFEKHAAIEIITDPDPANARAIRVYEKVGFVPNGEIVTPNGAALLMKLSKKALKF